MPVSSIAILCSLAAAMTSASRIEPPGCTTADAPAAARTSSPSRNGKKASDATAAPRKAAPALRSRHHGLFAPNAKLRPRACALGPSHISNADTIEPRHACADPTKDPADNPDAPHRRRIRMLWSQLLRRVFAVDVLRCPCGAEADRKLIGDLSRAQTSDALDNFVRAIGEPTVPPPRAKARPPPQMDKF